MSAKVLAQARIDKDVKENSGTVPLVLSQKDIKENSTENGNWLFDERERKFVKKEIVAQLESEEKYIAKSNKETTQIFLKRAMKAV